MNTFEIKNSSPVPALARAFALLRWVGEQEEPVGISEIARALGLSKATVHGLVHGLLAEGALEEEAPKRYRLGPVLGTLAAQAAGTRSLEGVCRPVLEDLARRTRLTAILGIPEGRRLRVALAVEGGDGLRVAATPGVRIPLEAGATGKVAMAWGALEVPARPTRFTGRTSTDPRAVRAELARVREQGVALDRGEYLPGVVAAAAPVLDGGGRLRGIVYAVGLEGALGEGTLEEVAAAVREGAARATRRLGGRPEGAAPDREEGP